MNPDQQQPDFRAFFAQKLKESGLSIKKLSDVSGIALRHLENISRGNLSALPASPYLKGYIEKLGEILEFDPLPWWEHFKETEALAGSGATDALPANRFAPQPIKKYLIGAIVIAAVIVYFASRFSYIFGTPGLAIYAPSGSTATVRSENFIMQGSVANGDQVLINNDPVPVGADGKWEKEIVLQQGTNTFEIVAKKFLGRETRAMREITYEPSAATSTPTSTAHTAQPHTPLPPSFTATSTPTGTAP